MNKLIALTKNTFVETLRQPVYGVITGISLLCIIISPFITMYTMSDDDKLLREICLSTLFLTSLFIAVFSASGVVTEEVENKTILTILSKPVSRAVFVISKFLGVALAVGLAHYLCSSAMLLSIRHGVLETARDTMDWTVLSALGSSAAMAFVLTLFLNYIYDWKFSSTAIVLGTIFITVWLIFLSFFDKQWEFNPAENGFNSLDIFGSVLLYLGALIIVALAVMFSARFNVIITLTGCIGIFLLGLVNDYVFGRLADTYLWAKVGRFVIPNMQVFWISDAIYESSTIPPQYILTSSLYAICYTIAIIALAIAVFQRRQVG